MTTRDPADLPENGDDIARYLDSHSAFARPGVDAFALLRAATGLVR